MILSHAHRLRYVNQLVGAFVILVFGLVFAAIIMVAWGQEWRVPRHTVYAYMVEEELDGLQVNTPVQILGERVGRVREIRYVDDPQLEGRLRAELPGPIPRATHFLQIEMQISDRFIDEVRVDSRIHIRRRLAGVGDVYLEVLRGQDIAGQVDQSTIFPITQERSAQDEVRTMVTLMAEVQQDFAVMRQSMVDSAAEFQRSSVEVSQASLRVRELAESMLEVSPRLPEIADEIQSATTDIRQTSERIRDTASQIGDSNRQLQNVLADAEEVSPRLLPIAQRAEQLLSTSQVVADRLRDESDDLPGTVRGFNETLHGFDETVGDAQQVIDGLRQNWLIRRHVEQPQSPRRIPPSKARVGGMLP